MSLQKIQDNPRRLLHFSFPIFFLSPFALITLRPIFHFPTSPTTLLPPLAEPIQSRHPLRAPCVIGPG